MNGPKSDEEVSELLDRLFRAIFTGRLPDSVKLVLLGMLIMAGVWWVNTIRERDLGGLSFQISEVRRDVARLAVQVDLDNLSKVKRTDKINKRFRHIYTSQGWDYEDIEP